MASYRPFLPQQQQQQQHFPPNPNQPLPPPPPRAPPSNPFSHQQQQQQQNNLNYTRLQPYSAAPFQPQQQQQQQLPYQRPPPAPAYSIPPPQPPSYYPTSSFSHHHHFPQQQPPPPPPASPPQQPPLPPPPSQPHNKERLPPAPSHNHHPHSKHASAAGPHRSSHKSMPPPPAKPVETEEERRVRKRREYEKQKQDEKRRRMMKESQVAMLQKTQMLASGMKQHHHGSLAGSRLMDRKTGPFLSAERVENRLKKPTTFLCKLKFRNELPDPTAQPKLLAMNTDKDRYTNYAISSLEKMYKPKLHLEPDLGIPLDLLDISVYNPPKKCPPLAPEDEELLRDSAVVTPVKQDGGIRRKERPTDKGVAWLVKTQYISSISTDNPRTPLSEKLAKEQRNAKEGRNNILETLNNREKQIQAIEESFKAAKLRPVHQTNPKLEPVEIFPLLPNMDRHDDQFVIASFDGDPTAESELYNKLDRSVRSEFESQAIMKSFAANGSDPTKPEKFLAYMVPSPQEILKDIYDESEDVLYSWVREYHWEVRADDADDPTTYLVGFDKDCARYLPLPTKLILQKKKAKEGRSVDEVEHFPVPSKVTVRRRPTVAISEMEPNRSTSNHVYGSSKVNTKRARSLVEDDDDNAPLPHYKRRVEGSQGTDGYSDEEDMSG